MQQNKFSLKNSQQFKNAVFKAKYMVWLILG